MSWTPARGQKQYFLLSGILLGGAKKKLFPRLPSVASVLCETKNYPGFQETRKSEMESDFRHLAIQGLLVICNLELTAW